jgi:hypothetical protein
MGGARINCLIVLEAQVISTMDAEFLPGCHSHFIHENCHFIHFGGR